MLKSTITIIAVAILPLLSLAANDIGNLANDVIVIRLDQKAPPAGAKAAFDIVPTYNGSVPTEAIPIIATAITNWEQTLLTSGVNHSSHPIEFSFDLVSSGALAVCVTTVFSTGELSHAKITFNTDYDWYFDPDPDTDDEFDDSPPPDYDLLSVARHELGHAVGWVGISDYVNGYMSGRVFDPARLNIQWHSDPTSSHTDSDEHPFDLMNSSIDVSIRRGISLYPDAAMLSRSYNYSIPMSCVDNTTSIPFTGDMDNPFPTVAMGLVLVPIGQPILLIPGYYHESVPLISDDAHTLMKARGGKVTISD